MSYSFELKKKFKTGFSLLGQTGAALNTLIRYLPIGEVFFVNGPLQYTETKKFRVSAEPTFTTKSNPNNGASVITDYGIDNSIIQLQGEFNLNWVASPIIKNPLAIPLLNATSQKSGKMEFEDFIGFLFYSRYTTWIPSSIDSAALATALFFSGFNHADWGLIWNDYDRNRRVEVIPGPNGVSVTRSVDDTFTIKFSMDLIVVKDINTGLEAAYSIIRNPQYTIDKLMNLSLSIVAIPLAFAKFQTNIDNIIANVRKTNEHFNKSKSQFSKNGQLAKDQFKKIINKDYVKSTQTKYEDQAAGVETNETLTDNPRTINPPIITDSARKVEVEVKQINELIGLEIVALPGQTLEELALDPNGSDFSDWILNELYEPFDKLAEAMTSIRANMLYAENVDTVRYAEVIQGESLEDFARRNLGDESLAYSVAEFNNVSFFEDLGNRYLKIPDASRVNNVLTKLKPTSRKNIERIELGEDLATTDDRDIAIDYTGDLAINQGFDCLLSGLIDVLETPAGSLPAHIEWGNPYRVSEVIETDIYIAISNRLRTVIASDSRIKQVESRPVVFDGDSIYLEFDVKTYLSNNSSRLRFNPRR
jgi:hypothetical protein